MRQTVVHYKKHRKAGYKLGAGRTSSTVDVMLLMSRHVKSCCEETARRLLRAQSRLGNWYTIEPSTHAQTICVAVTQRCWGGLQDTIRGAKETISFLIVLILTDTKYFAILLVSCKSSCWNKNHGNNQKNIAVWKTLLPKTTFPATSTLIYYVTARQFTKDLFNYVTKKS